MNVRPIKSDHERKIKMFIIFLLSYLRHVHLQLIPKKLLLMMLQVGLHFDSAD